MKKIDHTMIVVAAEGLDCEIFSKKSGAQLRFALEALEKVYYPKGESLIAPMLRGSSPLPIFEYKQLEKKSGETPEAIFIIRYINNISYYSSVITKGMGRLHSILEKLGYDAEIIFWVNDTPTQKGAPMDMFGSFMDGELMSLAFDLPYNGSEPMKCYTPKKAGLPVLIATPSDVDSQVNDKDYQLFKFL